MKIQFELNGRPVEVESEPNDMLVDVLREQFELTGPRVTCGIGLCGTCTVLVDGELASSCIMMAPLVDGRRVDTIEGVPETDAVVECFDRHHAFQCGYCIPGMVMTARDMVANGEASSREAIREGLGGNLCRCGSYEKIIDAIAEAAQ